MELFSYSIFSLTEFHSLHYSNPLTCTTSDAENIYTASAFQTTVQTNSVYSAESATFILSTAFWREPKHPYINFGELVCLRVGVSASWTVSELDCRRVGLSETWLLATWFVGELSVKRILNRTNFSVFGRMVETGHQSCFSKSLEPTWIDWLRLPVTSF